MKKTVLFCLILIIAVLASACADKPLPDSAPYFIDEEAAKDEIGSFTFGSSGWLFYHVYGENWLYAQAGIYILRYNIEENIIDRALNLGNNEFLQVSYAPDGLHAIVHEDDFIDIQTKTNQKYLIDFDMKNIELLPGEGTEIDAKHLPAALTTNFNENGSYWDIDLQNLNKLNYSLQSTYSDELGILWFAVDNNGQKVEIIELRNNLNGMGIDSVPCVVIDSNTIAAIISIYEENSLNIGKSKIVLIDLEKLHIIQECNLSKP